MSEKTNSCTLGVDFGGTGVKLGLVDPAGAILARDQFPTRDAATPERWVKEVGNRLARMLQSGFPAPSAVGVGVPGFVDYERGYLFDLPNVPGWRDESLARRLAAELNLPASVDNDVNVMALGECTHGAGRAFRHAIFVTLGTGVGGGLLLDGKIYRGAFHMAGEIGHLSIDRNGIRSQTGIGGLEQYVGNQRLVERCQQALDQGRSSSIISLAGGDREAITVELIAKAAAQGDGLGLEIFDFMAVCLATAFASAVYLIQPEAIIVGGGVSGSGEVLFKPLDRHLRERLSPVFYERLKVMRAELGNDAGVIGASVLARAERTRS